MKTLGSLALAAIAIVGGGSLLTTTGTQPKPIRSTRPVRSECLGVTFPAGTELIVLGAYEGRGRDRPREAGDHSPGRIELSAGSGGPLVLMLSAYEPVTWDLSKVPTGRLRGVIADGYYAGTVIGAATVPVRIVARGTPDQRASCGDPVTAYKGGRDLDLLVAQAETATGLIVSRFNGDYAPRFLSVDRPAINLRRMLGRFQSDSAATDIFPGAERLAAWVAQGVIRPARQADIDAYNRAATARLASGRLIPFVASHLKPGSSYVVLRPFDVPRDMYGANSRAFLIPAGGQAPDDRGSHNSYFSLADGHCTGPACGADD